MKPAAYKKAFYINHFFSLLDLIILMIYIPFLLQMIFAIPMPLPTLVIPLFAIIVLAEIMLFLRTRNFMTLLPAAYLICFVIYLTMVNEQNFVVISFIAAFFPVTCLRRYSLWHLMELAAKNVSRATNGFTSRPFPGGKFEYSMRELLAFARFLSHRLIAPLYHHPDRVILVFSRSWKNFFTFKIPNLQKVTYMAFDTYGKVTFHMDKSTYKLFIHELAYDEICRSFIKVVIEFFGMYKEGKYKEILRALKGDYLPEYPNTLPLEFLEIKGQGTNG